MFHVHGSSNGSRYTVTICTGKGPVADWTRESLEAAQDAAKFACRMALIYGYSVTLDLMDGSDLVYLLDPVRSNYFIVPCHVIGCDVGSFDWCAKEV